MELSFVLIINKGYGSLEGDIASYLSVSHVLRNSATDLVALFLLTVILVPSAIADYRAERIPNFFSMAGWIAGPAMYFWFSGVDGLLHSGIGFVLLFGLTFPLWLVKWFGAADVKLIASVGAIVGGVQALVVLLGIFVAGFVMAILVMIVRGDISALFRSLFFWQAWGGRQETTSPRERGDAAKKSTVPYAIPIAFGTLLTILQLHM